MMGLMLDLDISISGDETRVQSFTNCPVAGEVELWTILGGSHAPDFDDNWPDLFWHFFPAIRNLKFIVMVTSKRCEQ